MQMYYCNFGKLPPEFHPVEVMGADKERVWFTLANSYPRYAANEGYYESEKEALEAWVKFLNERKKTFQGYIDAAEEALAHYYQGRDSESWKQRLKEVLPDAHAELAIDWVLKFWGVTFNALRVDNLSGKEIISAITCIPCEEHEQKFWTQVALYVNRPEQSEYQGELPPVEKIWVCNECESTNIAPDDSSFQMFKNCTVICKECNSSDYHIHPIIPTPDLWATH